MAQFTAADKVTEISEASARALIIRRVGALFLSDGSMPQIAGLAALPVLGTLWLLVTPERMFSREMTWDLLFNLSGAWRIHSGHVPHVDFHDPIGPLGFWLTHLGFSVVGPMSHAFLVGQTIFLVFAFAAAVVVASRRLALIPAVLFVLYAALLVLMPVNVGDEPNAYSFAMSYNRWGWSVLTTFCLLLFLPSRRNVVWLDAVTGGVLLLVMFYLKITFAAAGVGALAVAVIASPHVRDRAWTWVAVALVLVANAAMPYNRPYVADIVAAVNGGYVRPMLEQFREFLGSRAEYVLYGSGVLLLLWMWRRQRAPLHYVFLAAMVLGLGNFVASQSAQGGALPIGTLIAYLIYDALRGEHRAARPFRGKEMLPLTAILSWPALSILTAMTSVAGYHLVANRDTAVLTVESTNLRGLAVPREEVDPAVTPAFASLSYELLSSRLEHPAKHQILDATYVQTLIEAASLFAGDRRGRAKILVIDQVNPMPFMLGYPPPRGGSLWLWPDMPPRPVDDVFGDVDVVLIPKFSTYSRATLTAVATYEDHLLRTFPVQEQSPSWTILSRTSTSASH